MQAAVKVGVTKEGDEAAYDRDRLHTLAEAAEAAKKATTLLLKGVADWGAGAANAHLAMADLNPLGAPLGGALDVLGGAADTFVKAREGMDEARMAVDVAVAAVLERTRALEARVTAREALRVDVKHYTDKLEGMRAKAPITAKDAVRIEENEGKRKAAVEAYEAAHAALAPDMEHLDTEVSGLITAPFRALLEAHARVMAATHEVYVRALAAPPPDAAGAAAAAAGGGAGGGAASGGAGGGAAATSARGSGARTPGRGSMFGRLNPFGPTVGAHDGWKVAAPPAHTLPGGEGGGGEDAHGGAATAGGADGAEHHAHPHDGGRAEAPAGGDPGATTAHDDGASADGDGSDGKPAII